MVCKFELRTGDFCSGWRKSSAKSVLEGSRSVGPCSFQTLALHELSQKELGLKDRNTETHEVP